MNQCLAKFEQNFGFHIQCQKGHPYQPFRLIFRCPRCCNPPQVILCLPEKMLQFDEKTKTKSSNNYAKYTNLNISTLLLKWSIKWVEKNMGGNQKANKSCEISAIPALSSFLSGHWEQKCTFFPQPKQVMLEQSWCHFMAMSVDFELWFFYIGMLQHALYPLCVSHMCI